MSFSALSSAWLFLLLVPLVVFYFLKLKRPRVDIPSLVLWRQVLSDQRVNSPFQKFRRNLLLLLQLLALTLLVLAAMQPFLRREASRAQRVPVLIDVSASMAALDRAGGSSRLDEVKRRVRKMIDGLLPEQELSLIAFGKNARRITPFTNDQRELRAALAALEVEDLPSDLEEALRLAQALGRSTTFDKVILFSDGNFSAQTDFALPFQIDYQRIGAAGPNFGIVACNARRTAGGAWEVFVQLAGSPEAESTSATLEVSQDRRVVSSETVPLMKGSSPRLAFALAGDKASMIAAKLIPNDFDSLAADNAAWLALPAPRPLAVFVPERLGSFRHALATMENLTLFPRKDATSPPGYDLLISDEAADLALPARVRCGIGVLPPDAAKFITMEKQSAIAIDWRRDSPLLQHVTLADVIFMDQPVRIAETPDDALAHLGYEILAHGARGPLILEKREGDILHYDLLFHTDRSTLPYRVAFPIFVANLVQIALREAGLAAAESARTGVLPPLTLAANQAVRIDGPAGLRAELRSDQRGVLAGVAAPRAGEYVIIGGSEKPARVGASLLSVSETSLTSVEQIEFGDQLRVAAAAPAKSDRSLWWSLALAGFFVLLVEWWIYQRRPGGIKGAVA